MVSLLDIADTKKTVPIRGKEIPVNGISAEGIAHLLAAFPDLRKLMGGKSEEVTPDALMQFAPRAVAVAIASGTGLSGSKEGEAAAAKLSIGEQVELLAAIIDMTFPQGFGPFVERLDSLGVVSARAVPESGKAPDIKSPAPSNG